MPAKTATGRSERLASTGLFEGSTTMTDEYDEDRDLDDREDDDAWMLRFADPGGRSSLRAATPTNPRIHPCPECGRTDMLTALDVKLHYRCDICADAAERGF